ncbi:hypothetical protein PVAP13_3KG245981 [Panicum virgatum]|uniref:Uncharacterized protein n=1 Tax=Panicum virgatum TaxID=38727 RepID=A0A8T0V2X3_PANVG|nr:hypothetical protein PVAP13_3KG245981 [Panicum virgatum]
MVDSSSSVIPVRRRHISISCKYSSALLSPCTRRFSYKCMFTLTSPKPSSLWRRSGAP